jgi:hypothetical protein
MYAHAQAQAAALGKLAHKPASSLGAATSAHDDDELASRSADDDASTSSASMPPPAVSMAGASFELDAALAAKILADRQVAYDVLMCMRADGDRDSVMCGRDASSMRAIARAAAAVHQHTRECAWRAWRACLCDRVCTHTQRHYGAAHHRTAWHAG